MFSASCRVEMAISSWYVMERGCGMWAVNLFSEVEALPLPVPPRLQFSKKVLAPPPPPPTMDRDLDGSVVNFGGLFPSLIFRPKEEWVVWEAFLLVCLECKSDPTVDWGANCGTDLMWRGKGKQRKRGYNKGKESRKEYEWRKEWQECKKITEIEKRNEDEERNEARKWKE
jgi:hypothetical protein